MTGGDTIEKPRTGGPDTGLGGAWRVIVLNDDHNTFQGVAFALSSVVPGVSYDAGMRLANRIHNSGGAIVWSGLREQAELYWEQGEAADSSRVYKKIIAENLPFERRVVSREEALALFRSRGETCSVGSRRSAAFCSRMAARWEARWWTRARPRSSSSAARMLASICSFAGGRVNSTWTRRSTGPSGYFASRVTTPPRSAI